MAERSILFNTEMVKAILDGRKTQTRRLVKGLPLAEPYFTVEDGKPMICDENGEWYPAERFCFVQPGDILWVRETWCKWWLPHGEWQYCYKATQPYGNRSHVMPDSDDEPFTMPWKPSIHMPREAARLFLRVKDVRIERLQDITASAAYNEGTGKLFLEDIAYGDKNYGCDLDDEYGLAREQFAWLWNSTVKKADLPRYAMSLR